MDNVISFPPDVPVYWISMLVILGMVLSFIIVVFRMIANMIIAPLTLSLARLESSINSMNNTLLVVLNQKEPGK